MEISGNTAFYSGLSSIQAGQARVDQAASQIAQNGVETSANNQSSNYQADRLHSVDRSRQTDLATNAVELSMGKIQAELGVKVAKASDEVLGTLIDTHA
jgi:hypothetical protein